MVNRLFTLLLVVPLTVNAVVWGIFCAPLQLKLHKLQNLDAAIENRPELEKLIQQSNEMLNTGKESGSTKSGAALVSPAVQRLAAKHRLQLKEIRESKPAGSPSGPSIRLLEISASGRFSKLALWMSDLENSPGFIVDSCRFESDSTPAGTCSLTLKVTAALGETPR